METDHWQVPLEELTGEADFPGVEVPRREAWGLVGTLPGAEGAETGVDALTLLFEAHCDHPAVRPG